MKKKRFPVSKVISGGQTGADRAALDAAMEAGVPHGGWCPRGRRAEDGRIPRKYRLKETMSSFYQDRTRKNVRDSDATLVFFCGRRPEGGSKLTVEYAEKIGRPCYVAHIKHDDIAAHVLGWLQNDGFIICRSDKCMRIPKNPVLNVAGPRESECPGIYKKVRDIMETILLMKVYPMSNNG